MESCRVCTLGKSQFVMRGSKATKTCIECSEKRRVKDYCEHNTRFHDCPYCQDPIVRRATSMVTGSRIADKKKGRECDLTFQSVLNKIIDSPSCTYCDIELQYVAPYLPSFCTIDRKTDTIGHTNENTCIACRSCNCYQNKYKYQLKL